MPKATVTVRELHNKDTGIDLSVTTYRELPGLVRSFYEYQIVVVSNLSCFKLPSHKDTDVVQFTMFKKFPDFEDLRVKLNEAFSGMAFPPIAKKSIIVNDTIIKERRNSLDSFMKFLSATPRIVTSSQVLTFLGVEAQKARRFATGETEESSSHDKEIADDDGEDDADDSEGGKAANNLFEDEEEDEETDDFLTADSMAASAGDADDDFFSTTESHNMPASNTRLFESQDLKRELTEEDEKDFAFVPDAIITKKEVITVSADDDTDDLLLVDDDIDLDKLLTLDTDTRKQQQQQQPQQQEPPSKDQSLAQPSKPQTPQKPSVPTKPKPGSDSSAPQSKPKPSIPSKPKPAVASKPKPAVPTKPRPAVPAKPGHGVTSSPGESREAPARPIPAPRKIKPQTQSEKKGEKTGQMEHVPEKTDLSSDDIMKYIAAANVTEEDADLDLFS